MSQLGLALGFSARDRVQSVQRHTRFLAGMDYLPKGDRVREFAARMVPVRKRLGILYRDHVGWHLVA